MTKFLNNVFKGLLLSFCIILAGGFLSLKLKPETSNKMMLISTSLANTIITNQEKDESKVIEEELNLDIVEKSEEELPEELKPEELKPQEEKQPEVPEVVEEPIVETPKEPEPPTQEVVETPKEVVIQGVYAPNLEVASTITPLATYTGKITAYGPDCYGCTSGRTASGQYVLEGNIYYNDPTFGNIRIVAADKSIPFGSIIRINGLSISEDPILAIVLDRGGMIGFAEGKHSYFDLLYKSEADASTFGRPTATFELLRSGY